jgi:hypothetical protein
MPIDDNMFETYCNPDAESGPTQTPPPLRKITGTMAQAGAVALGMPGQYDPNAVTDSTTASWPFRIDIADGTYDLIAMSDTRYAIRPALQVTSDLAVMPALDLETEGKDLSSVKLVIEGLVDGDMPTVGTDFTTASTDIGLPGGTPEALKMVPPDQVTEYDSQTISVDVDDGINVYHREWQQPLTSENAMVSLPPRLDGIRFTPTAHQLDTSWSTFGDAPLITFTTEMLSQDQMSAWSDTLETTAPYLEALGASSITIDENIPGFPAAAQIDFTRPLINSVTADWNTDPDYGMSRYMQGFTNHSARTIPSRLTPSTGWRGRSRLHRRTPRGWRNP